jgi:hypothetical protein
MLLRVYAAVGVLFVAWALIELKSSALAIWLRTGGPPSATATLDGEGPVKGAPGAVDATARRELQRAILPLST